MHLDERDTLELATREVYEPLETSLLPRYVNPGTLFVDLGANIGYYTLLAARLTGPDGDVRAFEPDPANFRLLQTNIEANGYRHVTADPRAVTDQSGTARLHLNPTNRGDHRLTDPGDGRPSVAVGTVRLDEALKDVRPEQAFVKMDIQGSEWKAYLGMRAFVARVPKVALVAEFWPRGLRAAGTEPRRLPDALAADGFSLYRVDEAAGRISRISPDALAAALSDESDAYTTLLGLKGLPGDPAWGE